MVRRKTKLRSYGAALKHTNNGMLSPVECERQQKMKLLGVWETRGIVPWSSGTARVTPST